ncbi:MAG: hypothetical protein ABMA64_05380 [Myxococcota bacterium]
MASEDRIPRDEGQDHPLHRWLTSRIVGQLDPGSAQPEDGGGEADRSATPPTDAQPRPARRAATTVESQMLALGASGFLGSVPGGHADEDAATVADDPATVLQALREEIRTGAGAGRGVDGDQDTVQLSRLPVSFISESVIDPMTAYDHSPEATRWREETQARIDEIPPGPLPAGAADRSQPTLAREAERAPSAGSPLAGSPERGAARHRALPVAARDEVDDDGEDTFDRNVIWVGLGVGAISGFVAVLVFVAWFAGRV